MNQKAYGFTIVELLIVIVVIGILAAISIMAYNGVSQKASNSAITKAASDTLKLMQAYIAEKGAYPMVASAEVTRCILAQSGCLNSIGGFSNGEPSIISSIAEVGLLPASVPFSGDNRNGIFYQYVPSMTVDGVSRPLMITYWLQGVGQQCGISGVLTASSPKMIATSGYTAADEGGKTRCNVTVPGPVHS